MKTKGTNSSNTKMCETVFFVFQLGLEADVRSGVVTSLEPNVVLKFQKTRPLKVMCKLKRRDVDDGILERCINVTNLDKVGLCSGVSGRGEDLNTRGI